MVHNKQNKVLLGATHQFRISRIGVQHALQMGSKRRDGCVYNLAHRMQHLLRIVHNSFSLCACVNNIKINTASAVATYKLARQRAFPVSCHVIELCCFGCGIAIRHKIPLRVLEYCALIRCDELMAGKDLRCLCGTPL